MKIIVGIRTETIMEIISYRAALSAVARLETFRRRVLGQSIGPLHAPGLCETAQNAGERHNLGAARWLRRHILRMRGAKASHLFS